jgi:hypothetical protein
MQRDIIGKLLAPLRENVKTVCPQNVSVAL